jgi:hypothetical protein
MFKTSTKCLLCTAALIAAATSFDAATSPSYSQTQCIQYGPRNDGGSVGVYVNNGCGRPVTFVVFGDGMDYLNLRPNSSFNWTTGQFTRWKACWGSSNTDC